MNYPLESDGAPPLQWERQQRRKTYIWLNVRMEMNKMNTVCCMLHELEKQELSGALVMLCLLRTTDAMLWLSRLGCKEITQ